MIETFYLILCNKFPLNTTSLSLSLSLVSVSLVWWSGCIIDNKLLLLINKNEKVVVLLNFAVLCPCYSLKNKN